MTFSYCYYFTSSSFYLLPCSPLCQQILDTDQVAMATGHASGALLGGVADPRHITEANAIAKVVRGPADGVQPTVPQSRPKAQNDENITFEEYHYWANRTRELEKGLPTQRGWLSAVFKRKGHDKRSEEPVSIQTDGAHEKPSEMRHDDAVADGGSAITDFEWNNARGATRTATWGEQTT
jgi:hypothetical protein